MAIHFSSSKIWKNVNESGVAISFLDEPFYILQWPLHKAEKSIKKFQIPITS